MRGEKGFSLIETTIGLVVFALIGIAIAAGLVVTERANMTNSNLTQAESLARSQMEYIQSQPYSSLGNYSVIPDIPAGFSFGTATPMVSPAGTGLQKITVSVKHDGNTLFILEDYKVDK